MESQQRKRKMEYSQDSYAKVNLFLDIISRLPNAYHEILTVFAEIDLHDKLKFLLTNKQEIKILSNVENLNNSNNLIYKIAIYLQNRFGVKKGVIVKLTKRIPIAAGLGGGSSNAATTIQALSKLWELDLSEEIMHEIAAEFGSDINFFLKGGTAIGKNRGEVLEECSQIDLKNLLLVNPNISISSKTAYQAVTISQPSNTWKDLLETNDPQYCYNKLEEGLLSRYPIIMEIKNQLNNQGAKNALLSGSGPTVIGFFDNPEICKNAQTYFKEKGYWSYITTTRRRQEK
jgi:4-diphosphocytidyl-2-C-methyl-D-erythritol kinase